MAGKGITLKKGAPSAAAGGNDNLRLLLLGRTGSGKSSLGNTLLGKKSFEARSGPSSQTWECRLESADVDGVHLEIVDTPGFSDTDPHRTDEDIGKVITEFLVGLSPGPHAVLIVINAGERFKHDDDQAYQEAKKLLGKELAGRVILVFTGADNLENDNLDISEELKKVPKLRTIVQDASGRFCSINNKCKFNSDEHRQQVRKLMDLVKSVAPKSDSYLTNALQQNVDQKLKDQAIEEASKLKIPTEVAHQKIKKDVANGENTQLLENIQVSVVEQHISRNRVDVKLCTVL